MHLVVLAAGLGRRFGGIKQLAPVGPKGESIMDALLRRAEAAGFRDAIVVIRPEIEAEVDAHFTAHRPALAVTIVRQSVPATRNTPLGTADAVLQCRAAIDSPFAVVNADDLYPQGAFDLLAAHLSAHDEHALVAFRLRRTLVSDRPVSRALLSFDDVSGALRTIDERRNIEPALVSGDPWVSMNMWGFRTSILDDLATAVDEFVTSGSTGEVLLPDVVGRLAARGTTVRVLRCDERCIGITYAEDVAIVRDVFA
ncbi:MAG TPA: NTP transferase domain-containing protein [Acidimicrobiales bacterium]|nr:NTP transferase domain-containing protein [Acidimicrobiales bacterium]